MSVNVAFDIPLDNKSDVTKVPKPAIAEKLESWKPPSPTQEDIQSKVSKAEMRRSENITNAVVKSASHNDGVHMILHKKKADEAIGVAILDEKIEQKLSNATVKRTKLTKRIVKKLSKLNQVKQNRGAKVRERTSLESQELAAKVEEKLSVAAERKEEMEANRKGQIAAANLEKVVRVADTKLKVRTQAMEHNLALENKLSSARERKDVMVSETVETLAQARNDKAARVEEARRSHEFAARDLDATIANKIVAADQRKERMKMRDESVSVQDRLDRAHDNRKRQEAALKELESSIISKLEQANERKARIMSETVQEVSTKSKAKLERAAELRKNSEMATLKLRDAMETKLSKAGENRNEHIAARSNNSSYDLSPSPPKKDINDIDAKLCEAAARREAHLVQRAEQAGFKAKLGRDESFEPKFEPTFEPTVEPARIISAHSVEPKAIQPKSEADKNGEVNKFNPIIFLWNFFFASFRPVLSIFKKK